MHHEPYRTIRRQMVALVGALALLTSASCSDDTPSVATPSTTTAVTTTTAAPASTTSGAAPTTVVAPTSTAPTTSRAPVSPTTVAPATTAVGGPTTAAANLTSPVTTKTPAPLFGAAIGSPTEDALAKITAALGAATQDTGWAVGCSLDHPTDTNERLVTWQHLRVLFRRDVSSGAGALVGYGYVLPEGDSPAPGDAMLRLTLPDGVVLGGPMSKVATAVGTAAKVNTTFGWVEVVTPGVTFSGDGTTTSAALNAVSVPHIFSCE